MFNKLKEVKDLRSQAKQLQNSLGQESVTVEHKDCSMKMDGNQKITHISLSKKYLSADNKEKLEGIVIHLHEEALKKVQRIMMKKMKEQGGFNLPGMS